MPTRLLAAPAMIVAGLMIAHQVAGKAVRDSTFLSAWPATALPSIVIATAIFVVALVPVYSWLLSRFSPRLVVPVGFLVSAAAHYLEWRAPGSNRWVAVVVYMHVAGFGALLLSGFWSLVSELFDPATARQSFGRIAASGTVGGLAGGVAVAQSATMFADSSQLFMLATLHALCGLGGIWLGRMPSTFTRSRTADTGDSGLFGFGAMKDAPHLKTLALMVVLSTAGAALIDFVFKSEAAQPGRFTTRAELLQFFAIFYTVIQLVTFVAQTAVTPSVRRLGLGRTMSTLPGGLAMSSSIALLYPTFSMFSIARGVEATLRGSFFRSAYELLFVPMDPAEKRRTKTFLDVTCDRAGDAIGAGIVQLVLFTAIDFQKGELLALTIATAVAGLYLARRLDKLYLGVVERHLVKQGDFAPIVVGSETGWTVIDLPSTLKEVAAAKPSRPAAAIDVHDDDPRWKSLVDLRSGDRARVEQALAKLHRPDSMQIAQVVHLLAWDDMVAHARKALEPHAARHVGLLVDEMLDPDTDFAIRRRIPRILGTVATERALSGLVRGLDDARFEVRYQCGRTMDRLLRRAEGLDVDPHRIWTVIERELSVPPQVWHGYQLIDRVERDDDSSGSMPIAGERGQRNLEHVFTLLSAVLPREPLQVAYHGIQSEDPGLRGLAIEYLDGVLPITVRTKLWALLDAKPPESHAERMGPEKALEELRRTQSIELPKR